MTTAAVKQAVVKALEDEARPRRSYGYYAAVILVILSVALIRFRLRDVPLERDEGEYAYAGQLILKGVPPYQLAYNMKLPGTYAAYAMILAIFGQTARAVHYGLLLVNAATIWLLYLLGARLFGRMAGIIACASYALLSVSPGVLGFAGHATHFIVLPAVAGLLLLLKGIEEKSAGLLFGSGLLFGLAFLMKQPGVLFAAFAGLYLLRTETRQAASLQEERVEWRGIASRFGLFSLGVVTPFLLTCLILWRTGVFGKFWFWTFTYARQYAAIVSLGDGWQLLSTTLPEVVKPALFLWILAGVGLTAFLWDKSIRAHATFVIGFFVCSFLAVCPGLYFREHYFILMLPALALLIAVAVDSAVRKIPAGSWTKALPLVLFVVACVFSMVVEQEFLFRVDPLTACRSVYGGNPFPEAVKIADYIKAHSSPGSRIAVLGSEPEIYFYSGRRSATGFIYTYGLMEQQPYALNMQREMASQIEAASPEFMVFVGVPTSWLVQPRSEPFIFSWSKQYLHDHYELVGIADVLPRTEYRWDDEVKTYQRRSQWAVEVYKRAAF
jgi:dolichyl-phosphate-mannose-protein mannosyltransferase